MKNWFLFPLSKLETGISNFSFYSRNPRSEFHISLSTLEIRDQNLVFLFLLSKFETRISNFSFYSRNSRSEFQISLSTLEFTFLTLVNACLGPSRALEGRRGCLYHLSFLLVDPGDPMGLLVLGPPEVLGPGGPLLGAFLFIGALGILPFISVEEFWRKSLLCFPVVLEVKHISHRDVAFFQSEFSEIIG